jgi:hypothetical protein
MLICKFYNSRYGCKLPAGKCLHEHVRYCTNELCVGAAAKTHTLDACGRKGGGGHDAFIAEKRVKAMAAKAVIKEELRKAKNAICENLYPQVVSVLTDNNDAGYKALMEMFPIDLTLDRFPGKVVGMLLDGLNLDELTQLNTDVDLLKEHIIEAVVVLYLYKNKLASEKPTDQ